MLLLCVGVDSADRARDNRGVQSLTYRAAPPLTHPLLWWANASKL